MNSEPATKTIFIATGISFSIAVAILIVAVLPAEFGIDPLGAGKRLGLLDLYAAGSELVSSRPQTKNYLSHDIDIPLSPFESMEFKYRLESGAGMVYLEGVGRGFVRLSRRSRRRRAWRGQFL